MKIQSLVIFLTATAISANFNYHEFTNSRGQCWRCYPNQPCEQCPRFGSSQWPVGWSNLCFEPNCNSPENRRFMFPSRESDRYFRCRLDRNNWTIETVNCRCGTLFNMKTQECVRVDRWSPYCNHLVTPIMITSCETGRRVSVLEYESVQPANTTIWEPTTTTTQIITTTTPIATTTTPIATTTTPIVTTITTPMVTAIPTTTESGGPGVTHPANTTTSTIAAPTTPGSCSCFPWWPCWCNPCWNMPCHNCNGCMG